MESVDIILGKLQEFKEASEKRFDKLESKVDKLSGFHWKVAGGVTVCFAILQIIVTVMSR